MAKIAKVWNPGEAIRLDYINDLEAEAFALREEVARLRIARDSKPAAKKQGKYAEAAETADAEEKDTD